jgi:hypothetical protein
MVVPGDHARDGSIVPVRADAAARWTGRTVGLDR